MHKRGQLLSQPFVYIFAILVIGFILVFGFVQVKKLLGFGKDVEEVKFKNDLQRYVDQVYSLAPGSSLLINRDRILIPSSFQGICFIDARERVALSSIPFSSIKEDVDLLGSSPKNVFIETQRNEERVPPFTISHLQPDGVVCLDTETRNFSFVIYNKGDVVGLRST